MGNVYAVVFSKMLFSDQYKVNDKGSVCNSWLKKKDYSASRMKLEYMIY